MIIKLTGMAKAGDVLIDERGKRAAKVLEIIGPVRAPYASAVPLTDSVKKLDKSLLYFPREVQDRARP